MKKLKKKIEVIYEKGKEGYGASAQGLPVFTLGDNIESLTTNMVDALNLYFEDKNCFVDHDNLVLKLDIPQFFAEWRVINAQFLARRINMKPSLLSEYVTGKRIPSAKQSMRIAKGIKSIGQELAGMKLV